MWCSVMAVRIVSVAAVDNPTVPVTASAMALVRAKSTPATGADSPGVVQHRGSEQHLTIDIGVLERGTRDSVAVTAIGVVEHGRREALGSDPLGVPVVPTAGCAVPARAPAPDVRSARPRRPARSAMDVSRVCAAGPVPRCLRAMVRDRPARWLQPDARRIQEGS